MSEQPHPAFNEQELTRLIEACLDGEASAEEQQQLQQLVASDEAAAATYVRFLQDAMHLRQWAAAAEADLPAPDQRPTTLRTLAARPKPVSITIATLVIGLILGIMAITVPPFYRYLASDKPEETDQPDAQLSNFVAQLTGADQPVWAEGQIGTTVGAHLRPGHQIQLQQGLAEITFRSGATLLVEGPAELTINSGMSGDLKRGKLVANVPEQAIGFTVTTPKLKVVDLGTKFGLLVAEDTSAQLHVFSGSVQASLREGRNHWSDYKVLAQNQSIQVAGDTNQVAAIASSRDTFAHQLAPRHFVMGSRLVPHRTVDTAAGVTLIFGDISRRSGEAQTFSFNSSQTGRWVTPLIFAYDPTTSSYRICAIGQSIQSDGSGNQSVPLVLVAGDNAVKAGIHTFGFFDGQVKLNDSGVVQMQSTNQGVIPWEAKTKNSWLFAHESRPRQVQLGRTYSLGGTADEQLHMGRTYAAHMKIQLAAPEPDG